MVGLINETIQGNYETVQQHHLGIRFFLTAPNFKNEKVKNH